uniref:NB-ARC domain-containing protein n=1 Tax=Physcomitrium patens TaxID=3218 RepID=A0A7I4D0P7_PHYPA
MGGIDSKAIKYWSEKVYEINIEELDEEKNMKLFITHYYGQEDFPNKLIDVGKNILRPCNGLLLSLKVIRVFLRENKRLRY